jgi:hypothetical protein
MTAAVRENPAAGRYAPPAGRRLRRRPRPDRSDRVLAAAFGDLASPLIASGLLRYYLLHAALPRLFEALSNLGSGRHGAYGIQPVPLLRRRRARRRGRVVPAGTLPDVDEDPLDHVRSLARADITASIGQHAGPEQPVGLLQCVLVPGSQAGIQRRQQVSFARIWYYGIFRCAGGHGGAAPCSREEVPMAAAGPLALEPMMSISSKLI